MGAFFAQQLWMGWFTRHAEATHYSLLSLHAHTKTKMSGHVTAGVKVLKHESVQTVQGGLTVLRIFGVTSSSHWQGRISS